MNRILVFIALFAIYSCSLTSSLTIRGKGNIKLNQVDYSQLPGWESDDQSKALISFVNSCDKFAVMYNTRSIGGQIGNITASDFRDVCDIAYAIKGTNSAQARNFFENWFAAFEVSTKGNNSEGLFTGYYEPEIEGSKVKNYIYQYPIYARPKDLGTDLYYSREEIENGALKGKSLEILYAKDPVDLFFLQVQGSGRVRLPNGSSVKLAFDGKNNHPYSSIGSYMIENNIIAKEDATYEAIRSWLRNNPEEAKKVMNVNASYVFFKEVKTEYVIGAQGVPLMPERSMAVDSDLIPYGLPIWVDTKNGDYRKLMVAQDTGSAIKGTVRGDVFFGFGKEAEKKAASMNNIGRYYIFLPINVVDRFSGR